jgi:uncharacterized membrane protein YoaK (UPF0700 family)
MPENLTEPGFISLNVTVKSAPGAKLRVALFLSASGGFLDAFTWLAHGGVFANAQSGNVVLLGVYSATGEWTQALRHVPPIFAFLLGVFASHRLRLKGRGQGLRRTALFSLVLEIVMLGIIAALPSSFPDLPIVLAIAFVAALQSSSFAKVENLAYSSVMTTGNLRRFAEALLIGITPPRNPSALHEARVFMTICSTFFLGAAVGAFFTQRFTNAALVFPLFLLVLALLFCIRAPNEDPLGDGLA